MCRNCLWGFLEYEEKIPDDTDGLMQSGFETLEFDHVSFSYKEEEILSD